MFTHEEVQYLSGATAYDQAGQKIGQVATIYQDKATGAPEWLTVRTGLFGMKETFVPLALGRVRSEGEVEFAAAKDTITAAPKIDPDGELSEAEEEQLFNHYGRGAQGYDTSAATDDAEPPLPPHPTRPPMMR